MHHHLGLRAKVIIMVSVMASLFLVALDQTIIATALGRIVEEFNAFDSLSWIVTAYMLTTTVTVPLAGKLSDLFGRRTLLLIGVSIFGVGSLLSGLSASIDQLIIWRALQGIGGGIITANAFTIVGDLFAARERGKWQGMIGAVFGLSSVVGPLLGGWLTDGHGLFGITTDWRWTFFINVPVAIVALALIAIYCPTLRHDKKPSIDYRGAALLTLGLATLILAVDNTETIFADLLASTGLTLAGLRAIMYVVVLLALAGFVFVERRATEPIVPLRFFKNRNFVLIMSIAALFGSAFMGAILYLTQFNQQVFAATPTESGLMLLPMVGGLMATSIISGQIISRTGRYKIFMQIGIIVATVMVALLATLTPQSEYWYEAVIMTIMGAGLGVVMPVMNLAVQAEFQQHDLGAATSSSQLFRGLGSTIGIAIFGAVLTTGLVGHLGNMSDDAYVKAIQSSPAGSQLVADASDVNTLLNLNMPEAKQRVTDGFAQAVSGMPVSVREQAQADFAAKQQAYSDRIVAAFSDSLRTIFVVSGCLMALASLLVFAIKERPLHAADPSEAPGVA